MTLLHLQLESILNRNPQLLMNIEPIIDEQDVARLLDNQGEIVERHGAGDPASRIHVDAQDMAAEIRQYLDCAVAQMEEAGLNGAAEVRQLRDYADQLQAHHLDHLDRLNSTR